MKKITLIILLISICIYFNINAQQHKVDSLLNELKKAKHDSTRSNKYFQIANIYYELSEYEKASEYYYKSLKINEELGNKKGVASCYNNIGNIYADKGSYGLSIENYNKALILRKEINDKKGIAICYNNTGTIYQDEGKYDKAIDNFIKSLKVFEELHDKKRMSACYNNIGNIYSKQSLYNKAIEYYNYSLKIEEELDNKRGIAGCYTNIGTIYTNNKNFDKAIEYLSKSLDINEKIDNKRGMSYCYNNLGSVYIKLIKYNKALECFIKSLKIREELNDKYGIASVYANLALLHYSIADSLKGLEKNNNLKTTIEYANKTYNLSVEIGALGMQNSAAELLKKSYLKLENYKEAIKYANIFIATNDSLYEEEKTEAIANVEGKYQNEKKQLEIEKLEKEKEKQLILIYSFVFGFIIILVFSIILTRLFLQKKKANILLAEQKKEIEIQHEIVIEQKKEITDSINYAKRIQTAVLQTSQFADNILDEHFVLFKPKDIVSGDFYWGKYVNEYLILAVADCTGHGVPGAFMSMLGVSFLNEIVRKKEVSQTNQILEQLRNNVIESLQQKGISGEQKDGMDISLVTINTKTLELQYSGANNSIYIISSSNNELIELKPDKMPIAIYENMSQFTSYSYQLQKGDTIYLMTDGYEDQFGGAKGKKFMSKQLKNLLITINNVNMEEQKQILETTMSNWIGEGEQIDDITVVGVRI